MVELRVGLEVGALVCDGDDFFDCLILLFLSCSLSFFIPFLSPFWPLPPFLLSKSLFPFLVLAPVLSSSVVFRSDATMEPLSPPCSKTLTL